MTRYIINSTLIFDSAVAKLTYVAKEENNSTSLSAPAARCLENLIQSRGNVLNKMTLLEKSWKDYGFVVTDNSVNQVISHIRKCFERLGFSKDIIVTVPKLGYQFNPEYKVDIQAEGAIELSLPAAGETQVSHDPPAFDGITKKSSATAQPLHRLRQFVSRHKIVLTAAIVTTVFHFIFSIAECWLKSAGVHSRLIDCIRSYFT